MLYQNINTHSATGRLLFNMLGAIAQFETEIRAERQMDGTQKAKERGVHFGRKKNLTVCVSVVFYLLAFHGWRSPSAASILSYLDRI